MKLLEIVRTDRTSNEVIATAMQLAKSIGKVGVLVGAAPGFVGNRMLLARQREADKLILEGAMPWDADRVSTAFGMPMGPFQMWDLAGLDLGWVKAESHGQTVKDILCEMGRFGQKSGAGYYDYDANRKPTPSPVTEKVIRDFAAKAGVTPRVISDEEILERTLYSMINEGAKILEEKKAQRASDIDVVWLYGLWLSGLSRWADAYRRCDRAAQDSGTHPLLSRERSGLEARRAAGKTGDRKWQFRRPQGISDGV